MIRNGLLNFIIRTAPEGVSLEPLLKPGICCDKGLNDRL